VVAKTAEEARQIILADIGAVPNFYDDHLESVGYITDKPGLLTLYGSLTSYARQKTNAHRAPQRPGFHVSGGHRLETRCGSLSHWASY
jgi:hypothetical protein